MHWEGWSLSTACPPHSPEAPLGDVLLTGLPQQEVTGLIKGRHCLHHLLLLPLLAMAAAIPEPRAMQLPGLMAV